MAAWDAIETDEAKSGCGLGRCSGALARVTDMRPMTTSLARARTVRDLRGFWGSRAGRARWPRRRRGDFAAAALKVGEVEDADGAEFQADAGRQGFGRRKAKSSM